MWEKIYRKIYPAKSSDFLVRKYNIPTKLDFKLWQDKDGWFSASSPQLPGLVTQGKDYQELFIMFNDAVLTYFDVPKKEGDIVYGKMNMEGQGSIMLKEHENQLQTAR